MDVSGLLLFLIIMIPNFIWFAVPAPNDILRTDSITGTFDTVASDMSSTDDNYTMCF